MPGPHSASVDAHEQQAAQVDARNARAVAYRDQLGREQGDFIKTVGDVLDTLIAELVARGPAATPGFAALVERVSAIKAAIPKP